MSVSSISSAPAPPIQVATPVPTSQATPIKVSVKALSTASSAGQEATETPDVTRREAAKGDRQAIQLLAKEAAREQPEVAKGGVNIKA